MIHSSLATLEALLPSFTWRPFPDDGLHEHDTTARAFQGTHQDWTVLVVTFAATRNRSHGRQDTARGYDGTATWAPRGFVLRLPRELAERCYKLATGAA